MPSWRFVLSDGGYVGCLRGEIPRKLWTVEVMALHYPSADAMNGSGYWGSVLSWPATLETVRLASRGELCRAVVRDDSASHHGGGRGSTCEG